MQTGCLGGRGRGFAQAVTSLKLVCLLSFSSLCGCLWMSDGLGEGVEGSLIRALLLLREVFGGPRYSI